MTGFGEIHPLPGIWDSMHLDTAVTLPIGVEAYAAFALQVWLTRSQVISERTRRFARRSAIAALVLGMAGQVAYHLLAQADVARAPWAVTMVVACLPVLVLGMGSALAHLIRSDSVSEDTAFQSDRQANRTRTEVSQAGPPTQLDPVQAGRPPARIRIAEAQATAALLISAGQPVSRRSLRAAGLHGSNADLGTLARRLRSRTSVAEAANS